MPDRRGKRADPRVLPTYPFNSRAFLDGGMSVRAFLWKAAAGVALIGAQWPWRRPAAAESPSRGRLRGFDRFSIAVMLAARQATYREAEHKRRAPKDMLPPARDAEDRRKARAWELRPRQQSTPPQPAATIH